MKKVILILLVIALILFIELRKQNAPVKEITPQKIPVHVQTAEPLKEWPCEEPNCKG